VAYGTRPRQPPYKERLFFYFLSDYAIIRGSSVHSRTHTVLDHATDVAAIIALTYISIERGEVPIEIVTAITSIALGARYAKQKAGVYQNDNTP